MIFASRSTRPWTTAFARRRARPRRSCRPSSASPSTASPDAVRRRCRNRWSSSPTCWSTSRIIRSIRGDLSYSRFKASRAYKKLQTDLHGAEVLIYYIQRSTGRPLNSVDHIRFWTDWIHDNNGRFKQASKLQGMG